MATGETSAPVVWLLTDNKPGHKNQLRGLGDRLSARAGARVIWIDAHRYPVSWVQAILGRAPDIAQPSPHIIVSAGSQTQKLLLACRKRYNAVTVVLMRPVLPLPRPDLAIIPAHDNPPKRPSVLVTRGVLNAVTPQPQAVEELNGLLLLGGPSEHYDWDSNAILHQINTLAAEYPQWHWKVTSSRRTPQPLIGALASLRQENLTFYHHRDTGPEWLPQTLNASRAAWVSPDSVSMVYEALTAGTPTGLLNLKHRSGSRVVKGLEALKTDGLVTDWDDRERIMSAGSGQSPRLWEADRAADWLITKYRELR